jgi:hypothetical protein
MLPVPREWPVTMVPTVPGVVTVSVFWSPIEKNETAECTPPTTGSIQKAPLVPPGLSCLIAQPEAKVPGVTILRQKLEGTAGADVEGTAGADAEGKSDADADDCVLVNVDIALDSSKVGEMDAESALIEAEGLAKTIVAEELNSVSVADKLGVNKLND